MIPANTILTQGLDFPISIMTMPGRTADTDRSLMREGQEEKRLGLAGDERRNYLNRVGQVMDQQGECRVVIRALPSIACCIAKSLICARTSIRAFPGATTSSSTNKAGLFVRGSFQVSEEIQFGVMAAEDRNPETSRRRKHIPYDFVTQTLPN